MAQNGTSRSIELKDLGNKAFADGDFISAEQYYRDAISLDGTSHILYTNLSAALLGQERYEEALMSANEAIKLDPSWLKAYFRKATALEKLGRKRELFEGIYVIFRYNL